MKNRFLSLVFLSVLWFKPNVSAQSTAPDWESLLRDPWVDSVMSRLSPRQRLAQLFMVAAYSNRSSGYEDELQALVAGHELGGVIFFQGGPVRQALLTNRLQSAAAVPLLVAMDAEWGLNMRLDSTQRFPYQMALGAIAGDDLLYQTGRAMGRHCRRLGVHINFAPVLDVNNNPANPVINFRSFGEDPVEVSRRGLAIARGLQEEHVLAVAKHFPGHGDTDVDSHLDLPVISHDRDRLEKVELFPFRRGLAEIGGVMVAHLSVPALDSTGIATTLSGRVVGELLGREMAFGGVVFTDALNMKGVSKDYAPGELDLKALLAGNDVLLFSEDVPAAFLAIENALRKKQISQSAIDARCRKILALKKWAGLDRAVHVDPDGLVGDLNTPEDELLNIRLAEASLTLMRNRGNLIPLMRLDTLKLASVMIGATPGNEFGVMLSRYAAPDLFIVNKSATASEFAELEQKLGDYNFIIASLHGMNVYPAGNFGIPEPALEFVEKLTNNGRAALVIFGNPYLLTQRPQLQHAPYSLVAYQETPYTRSMAAQVLFGGVGAAGRLPVSIAPDLPAGTGLTTAGGLRFKYTVPEEVGIKRSDLHRVDSLVEFAIRQRAIPGCQVMFALQGKVFLLRSYGYHRYDSIQPVGEHHLYDLASITKITGGLPLVMKLYDEGRIDLDRPLGNFTPYFARGNKVDITLREVLTHQSGLMSWIPFWKGTLKGNAPYPWRKRWDPGSINLGKFRRRTFMPDSTQAFPVRVSPALWLHGDYQKQIFRSIQKSPLGEKKYVYSDLSFLAYPSLAESVAAEEFTSYLDRNFYRPLGAFRYTYNPARKFPLHEIVPTEFDTLFRRWQIHGYVHDEGAAMLRGISGHAGLFGTANDLAKIMQMYLNFGHYGGKTYLNPSTLEEFTRCQYCDQGNRRALGFDRPIPNAGADGNAAPSASSRSFGHSGFTGTFTWVDPENGLLYVFLSNRVYPTRENTRLYEYNIRTGIQQVVYDALGRE